VAAALSSPIEESSPSTPTSAEEEAAAEEDEKSEAQPEVTTGSSTRNASLIISLMEMRGIVLSKLAYLSWR
jgi:hypothetical protein